VKRQIKIATDNLITEVNEGLLAASREAKKSIGNALEVLVGVEGTLFFASAKKVVAADTIDELKARVKSRKDFYQQARTRGERSFDVDEKTRILRKQNEDFQKKQAEHRDFAMTR